MADDNRDVQVEQIVNDAKGYQLSGKIMLTAIIVLFSVVVLMVALHLYARWYIARQRRRILQQRRLRRRTHIVFYVDDPTQNPPPAYRGLDPAVLRSVPVFAYSAKTHPENMECAVCLSEFEEEETGRVLPKCEHSFHVECIDMWFQSHSTCPLCRSPVEPPVTQLKRTRFDSVGEPGSSSAEAASLAERRKGVEMRSVSIEVPRRGELGGELRLGSPASQGTRSPGSRLMSLKRILSMGRRTASRSPNGAGPSCCEFDLESGAGETTRAHTPR